MKEAIEKLLEAQSKALNTQPFTVEGNQVILRVQDGEDSLWIPIAKFKRDFNSSTKIYSFDDLCNLKWETALENTAQKAIDKATAEADRVDRLVFDLLQSLE